MVTLPKSLLLIYILIISSTLSNNTTEKNLAPDWEMRVLKGFPCSTDDFPYMVGIFRRNKDDDWYCMCGGSLINAHWVLTAAHCVEFIPELMIGAALSSSTGWPIYVKVAHTHIHPNYEPVGYKNDIALLRLAEAILQNEFVSYVTLPSKLIGKRQMAAMCVTGLVMGWGFTSMDNSSGSIPKLSDLQCAILPFISIRECQNLYPYLGVDTTNVCTLSKKGKDACSGDSGGPLLCTSLQIGIVSWGIGCGEAYHPGVYTRVDRYLEYIHGIINNLSNSVQIHFGVLILIVLHLFY